MKTSEIKQIIKRTLGKHLGASPSNITDLLAVAREETEITESTAPLSGERFSVEPSAATADYISKPSPDKVII